MAEPVESQPTLPPLPDSTTPTAEFTPIITTRWVPGKGTEPGQFFEVDLSQIEDIDSNVIRAIMGDIVSEAWEEFIALRRVKERKDFTEEEERKADLLIMAQEAALECRRNPQVFPKSRAILEEWARLASAPAQSDEAEYSRLQEKEKNK